jgi:hypothetical protein
MLSASTYKMYGLQIHLLPQKAVLAKRCLQIVHLICVMCIDYRQDLGYDSYTGMQAIPARRTENNSNQRRNRGKKHEETPYIGGTDRRGNGCDDGGLYAAADPRRSSGDRPR